MEVPEIPVDQLLRTLSLRVGETMLFLGAGASISSGIPAADPLMWELRARLAETRQRRRFGSLHASDPLVQRYLQEWIASEHDLPNVGADDEYALLFKAAFPKPAERRRFLEPWMAAARPSWGYLSLAELLRSGAIQIVAGTNFDRLVEDAYVANTGSTTGLQVASSSGEANAAIATAALAERRFPLYMKLHGDYQFEALKNTTEELREQDAILTDALSTISAQYGLLVSGYSGRDESVMAALSAGLDHALPYPTGLFWCLGDGQPVPAVVAELLLRAAEKRVNAGIVRAGVFDDLLGLIADTVPLPAEATARLQAVRPVLRQRFTATTRSASGFPAMALNAVAIKSFPVTARRFATDASGGSREVRAVLKDAGGPGERPAIVVRRRGSLVVFGEDAWVQKQFADWQLDAADVQPLKGIGHRGDLTLRLEALMLALARRSQLKLLPGRAWRLAVSPSLTGGGVAELSQAIQPFSQSGGRRQKAVTVTGDLEQHRGVHFTSALHYAEAVELHLEVLNETAWLTLTPTVWIEGLPAGASYEMANARKEWRRERTEHRYNRQAAAILKAWRHILLGPQERGRLLVTAFGIDSSAGIDATFELDLTAAFARIGRRS